MFILTYKTILDIFYSFPLLNVKQHRFDSPIKNLECSFNVISFISYNLYLLVYILWIQSVGYT
jgi:hypothetical protein